MIGPIVISSSQSKRIRKHTEGIARRLVVYCPVRKNHYVISENPEETLVFRSDAQGKVDNYREEAGGRGMTLEECLEEWADGTLTWIDCQSEYFDC